jgi:hypothetical protein
VVGFSLQYEQDYPHVLEMLREGGLKVRKEDRSPHDPLVIAGVPVPVPIPCPCPSSWTCSWWVMVK